MNQGLAIAHESATLHVSGQARYADDIPLPANALHAALGQSRVAHGRIIAMDLSAVRAAAGELLGPLLGERGCAPAHDGARDGGDPYPGRLLLEGAVGGDDDRGLRGGLEGEAGQEDQHGAQGEIGE